MADPTSVDLLAPWLRRRVAGLRTTTQRRTFVPSLEVVQVPHSSGEPATSSFWRYDGKPLDRGLRVDLLCRLMRTAHDTVAVVLVRPGHHGLRTDDDVSWTGAAVAAANVCGLDLAAVVTVSRWGWCDLVTDRRRDWKRLRIRSG